MDHNLQWWIHDFPEAPTPEEDMPIYYLAKFAAGVQFVTLHITFWISQVTTKFKNETIDSIYIFTKSYLAKQYLISLVKYEANFSAYLLHAIQLYWHKKGLNEGIIISRLK